MDPIEFMPENSRDGTLGAVTPPGHSVDIPGLLIPSRLEGAEGGRGPSREGKAWPSGECVFRSCLPHLNSQLPLWP